jgi:hypothetical protein
MARAREILCIAMLAAACGGNTSTASSPGGLPAPGTEVDVDGDGRVDGKQVNLADQDGWTLDGTIVKLTGAACAALQDGGNHALGINVECEVVLPI